MEFTRSTLGTYEQQRVTITERITSGVVPWQYGRKGQAWRPESLRFEVGRHRFNGQGWAPWEVVSAIAVSGVNVKADGSDGAGRAETAHGWSNGTALAPVAARVREIVSTLNAEQDGDALPPITWDEEASPRANLDSPPQ